MKYVSTRGMSPAVTSAEAIKKGLAPDGGLYFPDEIPVFSDADFDALKDMSYPERAAKIMHAFLSDSFSYDELLCECREAYREESFGPHPAPLSEVGPSLRVLELWHGPTAAFKDMALQIMPRLFVRSVRKTGDGRKALILVATSGDTGKAALEGYKDIDGINIMVFYPENGVSRVQKLQMATQTGNNVFVRSVKGNFDDAQNGVKKIFSDPDTAEKLGNKGIFLSSANSINWGRLVPQVCYYVSAYCDLVKEGDIAFGEKVNVTVPTGNFGDILAGYIAKKMGTPIGKLVCASNSNNVLTDFFETGTYDRKRQFYTTVSPSMDILISSNLERLLFMESDSGTVRGLMKELSENGKYTVPDALLAKINEDFCGIYCGEDDTHAEIRHIETKYGYLIDTHTAVAMYSAEKYGGEEKMIVVSTASPYKFAPAVYYALTGEKTENELDSIDLLEKVSRVEITSPLKGIADRKIVFDPSDSIPPSEMTADVLRYCGL
ncbi:MAG: threonine synthase [Firmicutes bacterium]|nr:threonine synthase [Candidatus Colimorpha enterica]